METATIVAIVSGAVGALGFIFGIYMHYATHKVSKLTYKALQISDFGVPSSFLQDMNRSPVAITITSRGNKATENIVFRLTTHQPIDQFKVDPNTVNVSHDSNQLTFQHDCLNPSQQIKLSLQCTGSPEGEQIQDLSLSHSEGEGLDERQIRGLTLNFLGLEMEYDPNKLQTRVTRIGPIRFSPVE